MKRSDITDLFPQATDEQINKLMNINGADINSAKSGIDEIRQQLTVTKAELDNAKKATAAAAVSTDDLQKERDRVTALEAELNNLKMQNQIKEMRESVAKEKGIPSGLLTGDTEELCKTQADAILAFAKPAGYPAVQDGGEVGGAAPNTTREKFAAWAKDNL